MEINKSSIFWLFGLPEFSWYAESNLKLLSNSKQWNYYVNAFAIAYYFLLGGMIFLSFTIKRNIKT